jgi:methyl-accepting chemotaxis protein
MPQPYVEVGLAVLMLIAMILWWYMIRMLHRGEVQLEKLPKLNWIFLVLGFAAYAGNLVQFSFADACLLATAYFLCASAANPLFFLLAKTSQPATPDQLNQLEGTANSTALLAVGLALIFGIAGTLTFAIDTQERKTYLDGLVHNVGTLKLSADFQRERDSENMKQLEQNLDSKSEELKGLIAAVNERLSKIDKDIEQLRAGEARDSRVEDLLTKSDTLAASLKREADDISQQAKELDEHRKKIAELADTTAHSLVPRAGQKSSPGHAHRSSQKKL